MKDDPTPAESPIAKARLSLHQTVRLIDLLECYGRLIDELNKQITYLIIKHDNGIPSIYNRITDEKRKEINLLIEEFKCSLEEDRPSQSIVVNVTPKKSEHQQIRNNKITTLVSLVIAIITGIYVSLQQVGIIK